MCHRKKAAAERAAAAKAVTPAASENFKFFSHTECEFFPCHKTQHPGEFNCLFCYCPLYALGDECGGNFTYTEDGIKDCSNCLIPHRPGGYDHIMKYFGRIVEITKKTAPPPAAPDRPDAD